MPRRNMNTNAITAKIAAIVRNPLMDTHVVLASGRFVLWVLFQSEVAGSAGIADSTLPPTNGTNMVTMRYISAPIAVVARICIGVDCILACAISVFTLLNENRAF
jgi:hypothetical protein